MVEPRFRRRIPLELTAPEIDLLESHQPGYGTKRATLIAGLQALATLEEAQAEATRLAGERDAALARAEEHAARAEAADQRLQAKATKTATDTATTTAARLKRDLARGQARLDETRNQLSHEQEARLQWENAYQDAEPRVIDALRCPRCKQWASPDEWAVVEADDDGEIVYHKPCGYHQDGVVNPATIMGYRSGN